MSINPNKKKNNHRLVCRGYKYVETKGQENLTYDQKESCYFLGAITSDIGQPTETIGNRLKTEYIEFDIETYDEVSNITQGDIIKIETFGDIAFLIVEKRFILDTRNSEFLPFQAQTKITRFSVRGKL